VCFIGGPPAGPLGGGPLGGGPLGGPLGGGPLGGPLGGGLAVTVFGRENPPLGCGVFIADILYYDKIRYKI